MAERKPLVRVGGKSKQLPVGDKLPFAALPVGYNENTVAAGDDPRIVFANTPNWQGVGANVDHFENGLFTVSDPLNGPTVDYAGDTEKIWFVRDTYEVARVQTAHWASAPAGVAAESKIYVRTKPHWSVAWTPWVKLLLDAPSDNKTYGRKDGAWAEVVSGGGGIVGTISKADRCTPCLVKTGAGTLAVKAGTTVYLSSGAVSFGAQTAITMPALTAGEDYSVWVLPNGTAQAVADPFSSPATAPAPGALKIGGFHYGLVAPGATPASGGFSTSGFTNTGGNKVWTQADVDRIAGINEFSIWDLVFRSKGEQHGMVLDPQTRTWWGIYLCSTNHIANGISRYNTDVASGTVLPRIPLTYGGDGTTTYGRLSLYEAVEIAASHACRLPSYEEFMSAAFGVTEGQAIGGATSTIPATTRQAGYTSRIGIEQATGHHWIIGAPFGSTGGAAWSGVGRGSFYGTSGLPLFGGARSSGSLAGSRCSSWDAAPSGSAWSIGLRAACDHLQLD